MEDKLLLEVAKKKLNWYAMEASEEEFDQEAVESLVTLISKLDDGEALQQSKQDVAWELERFRAYCTLYQQEEKNTGRGKKKKRLVSVVQRWGLITAACIMVLIILGGTMSIANADEDSGFFMWLKKDEDGFFAFTTSKKENLDVYVEDSEIYESWETIPEAYQGYVVKQEDISLLADCTLVGYEKLNLVTSQKIYGKYTLEDTKKIHIGVYIYDNKFAFTRRYDEYELLYTNVVNGYQQDVFVKRGAAEEEDYSVCFYFDNREYLVEGNTEVTFLEAVSEEYLKCILDKMDKK